MAVKIRLLTCIENPKTKRVLRFLARHIKSQNVVVLAEKREVFRGPGSHLVEWVNRQ